MPTKWRSPCEPSEATAHLNLAATYRLLKRYDEAVDVYTRAIRFIPNHPELHSELGAVYTFQGKRREADHRIQKRNAD